MEVEQVRTRTIEVVCTTRVKCVVDARYINGARILNTDLSAAFPDDEEFIETVLRSKVRNTLRHAALDIPNGGVDEEGRPALRTTVGPVEVRRVDKFRRRVQPSSAPVLAGEVDSLLGAGKVA